MARLKSALPGTTTNFGLLEQAPQLSWLMGIFPLWRWEVREGHQHSSFREQTHTSTSTAARVLRVGGREEVFRTLFIDTPRIGESLAFMGQPLPAVHLIATLWGTRFPSAGPREHRLVCHHPSK